MNTRLVDLRAAGRKEVSYDTAFMSELMQMQNSIIHEELDLPSLTPALNLELELQQRADAAYLAVNARVEAAKRHEAAKRGNEDNGSNRGGSGSGSDYIGRRGDVSIAVSGMAVATGTVTPANMAPANMALEAEAEAEAVTAVAGAAEGAGAAARGAAAQAARAAEAATGAAEAATVAAAVAETAAIRLRPLVAKVAAAAAAATAAAVAADKRPLSLTANGAPHQWPGKVPESGRGLASAGMDGTEVREQQVPI